MEEFVCLNKHNFSELEFEAEDKVYYLEMLGCVICKQSMKNFAALFLHYKLNHRDFIFFNIKHQNSHTNIKEAHIVAFPSERNSSNFDAPRIGILERTIGYYFGKREKQVFLMLSLNDSNELKQLVDTEGLKHAESNGILMNVNKQTFKQYPVNQKCLLDGQLVLFDNVTGEILDSDFESSGYERDCDYRAKLEEKWLKEECYDISPSDEKLFNLWNRFIDRNYM